MKRLEAAVAGLFIGLFWTIAPVAAIALFGWLLLTNPLIAIGLLLTAILLILLAGVA